MPSNINTTLIDTTYPVAGQDNNSQGFRDNFSNTNSNFIEAKSEIEDMQNKGIFTSALDGGAINNNMNGTVLSSPNIVDMHETVVIHSTSAVNISIKAGSYHTVSTATAGGSITVAFTNGAGKDWPASGKYSKIRLEVEVSSTAHTITLPAFVTGAVLGLDGNIITVNAPGVYIYEFSTRTNGSAVNIAQVATPLFLPSLRTPASSIGAAGDLAGMSGFDANYIYVCTADYDGVASIWQRVATSSPF